MFPLQEGSGILLQFGNFDVFIPVKCLQVADVVLLHLQLDRHPLPWHEGPHLLHSHLWEPDLDLHALIVVVLGGSGNR